MNRLTERINGEAFLKGKRGRTSVCYGCEQIHNCKTKCESYNAIDRLAAYEDTGFEPEGIEKLDKQIDELYEKLNHYQTAGKSKDRITRTWKGQYKEKWEDFSMRCVQKLAAIEDLEEQGLLIKLPCKVRDTVYFIRNKELQIFIIDTVKVREQISIHGYYYSKNNKWGTPHEITIGKNTIGRKLFLTREEAEKALEDNE